MNKGAIFIMAVCVLVTINAFQVSATKAADDRVLIELYSQSLCPYCREFLIGEVKKAINTPDIWLISEFKLYPYGNARTTQNGTAWSFTCQHGVRECEGNVIQTCTINLYESHQYALPFIICLEEDTSDWATSGRKCASQFGLNWDSISACATSSQGNQWEYEMGVATNKLVPPHTYVPWVNVNGKHSTSTEDAVENDMVAFICSTYTGSVKIAACN